MIRTGNIVLQGCGRGVGAGKCAALMSATTNGARKCTPLTSAVDFQRESSLRSRARLIFAPKVPSAHERARFSPRNNTPLMSAVKLHE